MGWKRGGTNLPKPCQYCAVHKVRTGSNIHFGGFVGYSVKYISSVFSSGAHPAGSKLTVREDHAQLEQASLPHRLLLAWNTALPNLQIKNTGCVALRLCIETKRMVSSPLLSLLLESVLAERHVCRLCSCGVISEVVGFRGNEMRLRDLLVNESSR